MKGRENTSPMAFVDAALEALESGGLLRHLVPVHPISPTEVEVDGRRVRLFSSNDYLGLSSHENVREAAAEAARLGLGPRGASLICGYTDLHEELELELASLKGTEAALVFPTGYMANVGVLTALGTPDATIFSDELNHASIVDGCRLSRARTEVFRHRDVDHLESLVSASKAYRKVIVTDSVFSMEGVLAPLADLVELKRRHGCVLVVDEAHATLVFGKGGGGVAEEVGVSEEIDFQIGTMSKAIGALGGYVATSARAREWLLNVARPFVFSTSLPTPIVAAALAALRVARHTPQLRERLWWRVAELSEALVRPLAAPIAPVRVGDEWRALEASRSLLDAGFHVTAIRPPSVPPGRSLLRVTLSAAHEYSDVSNLTLALARLGLFGLGSRTS
jgi:8-amino-7-oxononanoate synthase